METREGLSYVFYLLYRMAGEVKEAMIDVVQRIPFGKVTNYGEIATIVSDIV
jgi:O6-methylguanine-DNA--protein-cysteine methyltransferase